MVNSGMTPDCDQPNESYIDACTSVFLETVVPRMWSRPSVTCGNYSVNGPSNHHYVTLFLSSDSPWSSRPSVSSMLKFMPL